MQFETDRLILREFVATDWPAVMAWQSNPLYLRYYAWTERTPAAVQEFVQMFIDQQQAQPRTKMQLAIVLRSGGPAIGDCGIRRANAGAHQADIGYEIAPEHWGHGYATEAARAIVEYGFRQLNLHRIWSWCMADNAGSAHVLEKLGMRLEGRLRDSEQFKGRYWDTLLYGMLREEWKSGELEA